MSGFWEFRATTVHGDEIVIQAMVVPGCEMEILLGADFVDKHKAVIDFSTRELTYDTDGRTVVMPFDCCGDGGGERGVGKTLLVRGAESTATDAEVTPQWKPVFGEEVTRMPAYGEEPTQKTTADAEVKWVPGEECSTRRTDAGGRAKQEFDAIDV